MDGRLPRPFTVWLAQTVLLAAAGFLFGRMAIPLWILHTELNQTEFAFAISVIAILVSIPLLILWAVDRQRRLGRYLACLYLTLVWLSIGIYVLSEWVQPGSFANLATPVDYIEAGLMVVLLPLLPPVVCDLAFSKRLGNHFPKRIKLKIKDLP
jgi:low temperature requirement protein LtrA